MSTTPQPELLETPSFCRLSHKGFTLANGSRVIVVTDPTTKSCAASMTIGVGSHFDPPEAPGLAHFCEHMLFLGTEENPTEGAYDAFVTKGGGHSNAWTENAYTTYYFTIQEKEPFVEAVKMFLPFFVCPTFTESGVEREVRAVHSEDERNHSVDYWRLAEVTKERVVDPRHPHSRYGNGNLTTLWEEPRAKGIDVRQLVVDFYKKHYVAEAACLAIVSPLEAEEVLKLVEPVMMRMRRGTPAYDGNWLPKGEIAEFHTRPDARGLWINVQPVKAAQQVSVMFPMRLEQFKDDGRYASHLLGHECTGSLLDVLKGKGLATALSCGVGSGFDRDFDVLSITVSLTPAGVANVDTVVDFIFQGVAFLKKHGVREDVLEDLRKEHDSSFQFEEVQGSHSHATHLSRGALTHGIAKSWSAGARLQHMDASRYQLAIDQLDARNAYFVLMVPSFEASLAPGAAAVSSDSKPPAASDAGAEEEEEDEEGESSSAAAVTLPFVRFPVINMLPTQRSRFHQSLYAAQQIPADVLARWADPSQAVAPEFALPRLNPFIAERFDVVPVQPEIKYPVASKIAHGDLYFKPDPRFATPKASATLSIESPIAYETKENRFFNRIQCLLLRHHLTELLYFAELGGIDCDVIPDMGGIVVSINGPTDKLLDFGRAVVEKFLSDSITAEGADGGGFEVYHMYGEQVRRELVSVKASQPIQIGQEVAQLWTHRCRFDYLEVLEAAENIDRTQYARFHAFRAKFLACLRWDIMGGGNVTQEAVAAFANRLEELPVVKTATTCAPTDLPPFKKVLVIPRVGAAGQAGLLVSRATTNPEDPNVSIEVDFQLALKMPRDRALSDCLGKVLSSAFFNQLRTNESLGYQVAAQVRPVDDVMTLSFFVQSASHSVAYVLSRIHAFVDAIPTALLNVGDDSKFTDESFNAVVQAQIASRLDEQKTISNDVQNMWIRRTHPAGFDHQANEVEVLKTLKKEDLQAFYNEHCGDATRRSITTVVARPHVLTEFFDAMTTISSEVHPELGQTKRASLKLLARSDPAKETEEIKLPDVEGVAREYLIPETWAAFRASAAAW